MIKIEFNIDNFGSIFTENISGNHQDFIILPTSISCKLEKIYINDFSNLISYENFNYKSASFFSSLLANKDKYNLKTTQRISYKTIRSYFCNFKKGNKNYTYKNYLEAFSKSGLLRKKSNHSDTLGVCAEYELTNLTIDCDFTIYIFNNKEIYEFKIENQIENLDKRFIQTLKTCKINLEKYIQIEFNKYITNGNSTNFFRRINRAINFNSKKQRTIHYGSKVERIYHPMCFITRESRDCLNIKFHSLDIVNCQPLLLCYYLKSKGLQYDDEFIKNVESGRLYESIKDRLENVSRDEVKKMVYSEILFDFKTAKKNRVNKVFKEIYPLTYSSLEHIHLNRKTTKNTLASILQNLEADLFNNLNVINSEYYFTLFDAIYYNDKSDEDNLKSQISKYFINLNLNVSVSDK